MFAYSLDLFDPSHPTYDCVPLVYGSDVCCVGIPISWTAIGGGLWDVWCIISAGEVLGVTLATPFDGTLISVSDSGQFPILRDGVNLGTQRYAQTTIANITTSRDPRCCNPRFRVATGRSVRLFSTAIGVGDTVVNVTTHQTGSAVTAGISPIAIAASDQWYAYGNLGIANTIADILFDMVISRDGLGYLSAENSLIDWGALRDCKLWAIAQGFKLRGQYWGREPFARFATRLAAQSGCILTRRDSQIRIIPERTTEPIHLFTSANTNTITFRFLPWYRHTANRISSHNCDFRIEQQRPGLLSGLYAPAPARLDVDWTADSTSAIVLQQLWLDSVRRQDLQVEFITTTLIDLGPGDMIQVIHPSLEQSSGERSGYWSEGSPSWEDSAGVGQLVYQLRDRRIVGTPPPTGSYPAALTFPGTGYFRITEIQHLDKLRSRITAIIRPPDMGRSALNLIPSN